MTKTILLTLCGLSLSFSTQSFSATKSEKNIQQVEARVEQLRKAMVDGDGARLKELSATELNYGHSGGHVENQAEFIDKIVSGKSDFVTIDLKDQKIQLIKDIAIVRHQLVGTTNNQGEPGVVDIGVMLIWKKQNGKWTLLARQAFKNH